MFQDSILMMLLPFLEVLLDSMALFLMLLNVESEAQELLVLSDARDLLHNKPLKMLFFSVMALEILPFSTVALEVLPFSMMALEMLLSSPKAQMDLLFSFKMVSVHLLVKPLLLAPLVTFVPEMVLLEHNLLKEEVLVEEEEVLVEEEEVLVD